MEYLLLWLSSRLALNTVSSHDSPTVIIALNIWCSPISRTNDSIHFLASLVKKLTSRTKKTTKYLRRSLGSNG